MTPHFDLTSAQRVELASMTAVERGHWFSQIAEIPELETAEAEGAALEFDEPAAFRSEAHRMGVAARGRANGTWIDEDLIDALVWRGYSERDADVMARMFYRVADPGQQYIRTFKEWGNRIRRGATVAQQTLKSLEDAGLIGRRQCGGRALDFVRSKSARDQFVIDYLDALAVDVEGLGEALLQHEPGAKVNTQSFKNASVNFRHSGFSPRLRVSVSDTQVSVSDTRLIDKENIENSLSPANVRAELPPRDEIERNESEQPEPPDQPKPAPASPEEIVQSVCNLDNATPNERAFVLGKFRQAAQVDNAASWARAVLKRYRANPPNDATTSAPPSARGPDGYTVLYNPTLAAMAREREQDKSNERTEETQAAIEATRAALALARRRRFGE